MNPLLEIFGIIFNQIDFNGAEIEVSVGREPICLHWRPSEQHRVAPVQQKHTSTPECLNRGSNSGLAGFPIKTIGNDGLGELGRTLRSKLRAVLTRSDQKALDIFTAFQ
jgi:hypothetical protein